MKKFIVPLRGDDTCEFNHIDKNLEVEANNEEEAKEKAKQWCDENSYMGGYDWGVVGCPREVGC